MFSYKYYLLIATFFTLSCQKSSLTKFGTERGLYFTPPEKQVGTDSVVLDFSFVPDLVTDSVIKIPVHLFGRLLDVPIRYNIIANNNSTAVEGKDYEWVTSDRLYPINSHVDSVHLKIIRTKALLTDQLLLELELKSDDNFQNRLTSDPNNISPKKMRLFFSDIIKLPEGWNGSTEGIGFDHYLGPFSRKKLLLLQQLSRHTPQNILNYLRSGYAKFFSDILAEYLKSQQRNGNIIAEADGSTMVVGPFYK